MLEIEDNDKFDEILINAIFTELDITYSPMNEQYETSKELLGVASALADNANGTTGMAHCDVRCRGYACGTGLMPICPAPAFVRDLALLY